MQSTLDRPSYRRKMGYPSPRKSQQATGRPMVPFLHRKRQHRYSYLSDAEEDEDTGKEPPGFFTHVNSISRFNRHRDDLSVIPMEKSLHAADDDTVATSGSVSPEKVSWSTRDLGLLFKHLNASQPNIDGSYRSKHGRGYMPPALSCRKDEKHLSSRSEKSEKSDSDAPTEIESSEDESSVESRTRTPVLLKSRLLRFADELGLPLTETNVFEDDDEERTKRLIILLLSPNQRKFEFVHASYRVLERMTFADIIEQLPDLATNEVLAKQRYTGLCRVRFGYQELINSFAVQNCGLSQDEVLIAIVEGYKGKDLVQVAMPIFASRPIVRAVKLAKRSGRAVQVLQSRAAMDHRLTTEAKKLEEKHPRHVEVPPDLDEVAPQECATPMSEENLGDHGKLVDNHRQLDHGQLLGDADVIRDADKDPDSAEELDRLVFSITKHADLSNPEAGSAPNVSSARYVNTSVALTLALFVLSSHKADR